MPCGRDCGMRGGRRTAQGIRRTAGVAAAEETTAGLVRVVVQPLGRRVDVPAGTTVLAAVRAAGMELVSVCGGRGLCGTCRVLAPAAAVSRRRPSQERELLAPAELSAGVRSGLPGRAWPPTCASTSRPSR